MTTRGALGVKGVKSSGNQLTFPAGSTTVANHCVIPSRDILRPRRGQTRSSNYIDNDATDANSNRPRELFQWGTSLLINYTGSGGYKLSAFSSFGTISSAYVALGSFAPPDPTVTRMKFVELAKSIYWTTDAGLYALDAITGTARVAGYRPPKILYNLPGVMASKLTGNPSATGSWLAKDRAVAYRATVGHKDANGRVVVSAASGRVILVNPADVTVAIGGLVRNTNVVTATVAAHKFRVGDIVDLVVTGADIGNFDTTNNVITAVTATTITWSETAANYTNAAGVTITSGTKSTQVIVFFDGVAAGDFVELYRTSDVAGEAVDPSDEMFKCYERALTSTDISNAFVTLQDATPSGLLGDPLDSNANTGEGALGINTMPPLCRDLCAWDGRLWGGHTTDRHRLRLRLLGTGSPDGLQAGDVIAVNSRAYIADSTFALTTSYLPTENVARTTYDMALAMVLTNIIDTSHEFDGDTGLGYVSLSQWSPGTTMSDGGVGTTMPAAIYAATTRASAFGDALAALKAVTAASTARTLGTTVTVRCTGHGFTAGQSIMMAYVVGTTPDANFPVGLKTVSSVVDADNFRYLSSGSNVTLSGSYYVYAITYKSDDNKQPLRFSRPGLPDAWPLANSTGDGGDGITGLPSGAEVLRIKPTPDGGELLVCLRNGDIYALGGQHPYSVRRVDGSAQLAAADSLAEHANQLYALTTQGPATIGSNGVGVVGVDIEDEWRTLLRDMSYLTTDRSTVFAMSYESDRQYQLWVPNSSATAETGLIYHSMAGQWTRWPSMNRTCGIVFRGADRAVMGSGSTNKLIDEQKTYSGLSYFDYTDGIVPTTVNGNQTGVSTVNVATMGSALNEGDLVTFGPYYRVTASTATSVTIGTNVVTVANGDSVNAYRSYTPSITFAVEAAGLPGVEKKFREVQLHFGRRHFQTMTVTFSSEHSDTETKSVAVTPNDTTAILTYKITHPSTIRVEVPQAMRCAAMLTITISITEALSWFDLLGYSVTFEPISERTGK